MLIACTAASSPDAGDTASTATVDTQPSGSTGPPTGDTAPTGDPAPPCTPCPRTPGGFTDCFATSGIDAGPATADGYVVPVETRVLPGDVDGDDLPDLFVANTAGTGRLYRNLGDLCFVDVTDRAGLDLDSPYGGLLADLDDDGDLDLVVTSLGTRAWMDAAPGSLVRTTPAIAVWANDGDGRFTEVTEAWGFARATFSEDTLLLGADALDVDGDGTLDVVPRVHVNGVDAPVVYMSQPDGTWALDTTTFATWTGESYGLLQTDLDDDGRRDLLWIFHDTDDENSVPRALRDTPRGWRETVPTPTLFGASAAGTSLTGSTQADWDGDGDLDYAFMDNSGDWLARNNDGTSLSLTNLGLIYGPHGARFVDADLDGWPDLVLPSTVDQSNPTPVPNTMLRNDAGTFVDATAWLREPAPAITPHTSVADLDRDGRPDLVMTSAAGAPRLLVNDLDGGTSLVVVLEGRSSNRMGLGARIEVDVGGRTLVQLLYGGGNPGGFDEARAFFGLGDADGADAVRIRWPSGITQTLGPAQGVVRAVEPPR